MSVYDTWTFKDKSNDSVDAMAYSTAVFFNKKYGVNKLTSKYDALKFKLDKLVDVKGLVCPEVDEISEDLDMLIDKLKLILSNVPTDSECDLYVRFCDVYGIKPKSKEDLTKSWIEQTMINTLKSKKG